MTVLRPKSRVLVTLELPDPDPVPPLLVDLLGSVRVLLLGWYEVPEQTSPEHARGQVEDTGEDELEAAAEQLRRAGAEVDTRLVFTPDVLKTVQRLGAEEECQAALISVPLGSLERILVVHREEVPPATVAPFITDLTEERTEKVTLLHISVGDADDGRYWSRRILDRLEEDGADTARIESRVETAEEPDEAVLAVCRDGDYDVVVVPEAGELEEGLFGSFSERVAREAEIPVLVLRVGEGDGDG